MDLSQMRARVRQDLHDEVSSSYRWTDAELDRHIQHAVRELGLAAPQEAKATLSTTAGSRDLSISSLADVVLVEAVEYPVGKYPPVYVPFSLWGSTLSLLVEDVPNGGESVYVFYGKLHTLNTTTSTVPSPLEDLVAIGAEGYAALEWASFATNRVNVGGTEVRRYYQAWGQERLDSFLKGMASHSRRNRVRARHLYAAAQPRPGQSTDWGP
ncbi:MAG: hypothetical protein HW388_728 [Dehalococcoidia bacterium]|nr:hypothetical protein [Dehalococcoidia bacterium]